MSTYKISNNIAQAEISSQGAELKSLRINEVDILWRGDSKWWGKSAPILFPNIGFLKDGQFIYQDKRYALPKHGFLRDSFLDCIDHNQNSVTFELLTNSLEMDYPFIFSIKIKYTLENRMLLVKYIVKNNGLNESYFSIGSHPAIKLFPNTLIEDYKVEFDSNVQGPYYLKEGLIELKNNISVTNEVSLSKDIFKNDALIFKSENITKASLVHRKSGRKIVMDNLNCSYFGIWAPVGAPFVCLEPWNGIPDSLAHDGQLINKEGIIKLDSHQEFLTGYALSFGI